MAQRNAPNINLTQAFKIKSMSTRGVSQKDISTALGIHRNTVSNILVGKGAASEVAVSGTHYRSAPLTRMLAPLATSSHLLRDGS